MKFSSVESAGLERQGEATGDMEKMHGKRNERCWHARKLKIGMCGGCLSVAFTRTGVRGNDDESEVYQIIDLKANLWLG